MKYLRVLITASRLTKLECSSLVEEITARVHIWATRKLSFAGRAMLINGVIFEMYNCWASIFLLPKAVVEKITSICRNYVWGGTEEYTRVPHISCAHTCQAKKHGGIWIKDYDAWNKATIAKLVWAIATKKDVLWVKWVHGSTSRTKTGGITLLPQIVVGHGKNLLHQRSFQSRLFSPACIELSR